MDQFKNCASGNAEDSLNEPKEPMVMIFMREAAETSEEDLELEETITKQRRSNLTEEQCNAASSSGVHCRTDHLPTMENVDCLADLACSQGCSSGLYGDLSVVNLERAKQLNAVKQKVLVPKTEAADEFEADADADAQCEEKEENHCEIATSVGL